MPYQHRVSWCLWTENLPQTIGGKPLAFAARCFSHRCSIFAAYPRVSVPVGLFVLSGWLQDYRPTVRDERVLQMARFIEQLFAATRLVAAASPFDIFIE